VCVCLSVGPSSVRLSYVNDVTFYVTDDVTVLPLNQHLPITLRCHVTVLSANHLQPNVTVSFDDVDVTSQFVRSTTLTSRSQDGGLLTTTDYAAEFAWNVTLRKSVLDLHWCNWSCSVEMSHYQPLVTSSLIHVTRTLYSSLISI